MKLIKSKWLLLVLCFVLLLPAAARAQQADTFEASAELRVSLEQLLGEHALLTVLTMQKRYDRAGDYNHAALLLETNTMRLRDAIAAVYGAEAGNGFKQIWSSHIGYLTDYVKATAANDEAGRTQAVSRLGDYRAQQAAFFTGVNPNNFKARQLEEGLNLHTTHLLDAFNAYVNKDYSGIYSSTRKAYKHMIESGAVLAGGIAVQNSDKYVTAGVESKQTDLRSGLGRLLGEYALLAVIAMQKGADGKDDFAQAAAALGQNMEELSALIASVYGEHASIVFREIWASHIGYLMDYVKATADKDETARRSVIDNLEKYRAAQAKFFVEANPGNFIESEIAKQLGEHTGQLISAFDNYVRQDYAYVYSYTGSAYAHMTKTAASLAKGISAQFPALFPGNPIPAGVKTSVVMKMNSLEMSVNGSIVMMDVYPAQKDGFTLIPLRYAAEGIGATVKWDQVNRTALLQWPGHAALFSVGSENVIVDGQSKISSAAIVLQGDRAMIPVSLFVEATGWTADLADEGKTIRLLAP